MHPFTGSVPELLGFDPLLMAGAKELQYPAGRVLFRSGDRPTSLFFILEGQAMLQRVTVEGTPVTLQRTNRGFLAEASLTTSAYHCDALCKNESRILAFPIKELREAIDRHAPTRWAWISLLSIQSRQQRLRIERLALNSLRDRLKHLVFTEGTAPGSYAMTSTRSALAGELGVTPAALYRTLASLTAEGIISLSPTTICWHG
jgi:CRP/FNR family transcriptional regulator, dissimilatory nitrate respiration regulator